MRREKELLIKDRGNELRFKIREMSAIELDSWLTRLGLLRQKAGLKDNFLPKSAQTPTEALLSPTGCFEFEELWPLMNEMLACCRRVDGGVEQICTPNTVDSFIADVRTLDTLRMEALQLNLDFI